VFSRLLRVPERSFFLFGPRGTGKSSWVRERLPGALFFDLLESDVYLELAASPQRLAQRIPPDFRGWVVLDEVQKIPEILDEVHRLIESRKLRFALTGSSARKLRRKGVNLLAGRAITRGMHPLTRAELGSHFDLKRALELGNLPTVCTAPNPTVARQYLKSYVTTYLREEVQQEGLTRNVGAFGRFLEAASLSQAAPLNISLVARDCQIERKVVEAYFGILEDLLLAVRVPAFTKRAKRRLTLHPKFYFFDAGVFRAVRPRGPLDSADEIEGPGVETLVFQELRAMNDYCDFGYSMHYWRTATGAEVDFVMYGERGLLAFEVKRASRVRSEDLRPLEDLLRDYPVARAFMVYGGSRDYHEGKIRVLPIDVFLRDLGTILGNRGGAR
jgi:predicted AAA+ superfamily ATPase